MDGNLFNAHGVNANVIFINKKNATLNLSKAVTQLGGVLLCYCI